MKISHPELIGFWHEYEDYGCLSNWYKAEFEYAGISFSSVEQFMMYQKVMAFRQYDLGNKIMNTSDPAKAKTLGGTPFSEFDTGIWDKISYQVVKRAVRAKFIQNPDILEILLSTGNAILAECSARDKKWGIGIDISDPSYKDISKWKGKNYLGRILMEVREELAREKKLSSDGTLVFRDAHHAEPIPEWNMTAGELKRIPQFYNTIHAYSDTLLLPTNGNKEVLEYFYGCELCGVETAMATNMGGGLPIIGFFEMKQDIYDTARLINLAVDHK